MSEAVCERCGSVDGHTLLETDCILRHPDHADRYMGMLCRRHYHWIEQTLTQITELYSLLPFVIAPISNSFGGSRSSGSIDSPAPGRIEVMALTDGRMRNTEPSPMTYERNWNGRTLEPNGEDMLDVPGTLASWARMVIEERRTTDELNGTVTGSIRILHRERQWIARQAWVDEYTGELTAVHLALARGAGDSMWPRSIGKCPNCTARLYNTVGLDIVTCRKCGSSWTGVHLARLRLVLEQEATANEQSPTTPASPA